MQIEIAEILNDIREENQQNVENFEKLLSSINTKLEVMSEDNEAVELVRFYIAELKKAMEDRFSASMIKCDAFEASLDGIVSTQEQVAKTSELKDLFKVFSAHNDAFMAEISNQKNLLDILDAKLSQIDEKSIDKEELTSLVQDVSLDLSVLGENIQNNFSQLEQKLNDFDTTEQLQEIEKTVGELKELLSVAPDYSGEFENLENKLENIVSESDFSEFRADLADFVQKIIDNSSALNSELAFNTEKVLDAINSADYSELKDELSVLKNYLNELKEVSYQTSFEELSKTLERVDNDVHSLQASIGADVQENYGAVKLGLDELVANLHSVKEDLAEAVSGIKDNDDNNYSALKEYVEKVSTNISSILDGMSVVKTDTVINREKLYEITEKIDKFEPVDYSNDFKQISDKLDDLSVANSDINTDIYERFENLKKLVESLDNSDAIKLQFEGFERAFSKVVTAEDFLNFKTEFAEFIQKIIDNSNALYTNSNSLNDLSRDEFEKVNSALVDLSENVQYLKGIFDNKPSDILDNITSSIDNAVEQLNSESELNFGELKKSFEKIASEISEIKDEFAQKNDANVFSISSGFDNVRISLENLLSALHSMGATSESISAIDEKINRLNEVMSAFSSDLLSKHDEVIQHIDDTSDTKVAQIKSIFDNIENLKGYIDESVECLKNYMSELEVSANEAKASGDEKLTQKLFDLETAVAQSASEYEQKVELLQAKITEFAHIVENSNSDTEGKIASSLNEIEGIKSELVALNDGLKSSKLSSDEKFAETISLIDAGIENIIFNVTNISDTVVNGTTAAFKENMSSVEEKFDSLCEIINEVKNLHTISNVDLIQNVEGKISALKEELGLINSDIANAVECKAEDIIRAFEPVKTSIEEFVGFDAEKILADLKSQIELSFMNFSVDINGEIVSNTQAVSKLEQAFKEAFSKLSSIEDCLNEQVQNDLELLSVNLETAVRDVKVNLETKIEEQVCELRGYLEEALDDSKLENSIDEIGAKLDVIVSDNSINELSDRVDEILGNVNGFAGKFDNLSQADARVSDMISNLHEKIDILVTDSVNNDFAERFDNLSQTDAKVSDMISVLHEKVDTLVADSSDFDILEEIDGIKDIIFEQRKFFEASSDEKASAIDKYLRDVLLKLDNVDLEKNADDIKESILNALVSLVDQISFVEETEEIKDFVEEKTEEINQNLLEVRNQLKQLTSAGDDFDYVYTLQDVESDIAKLRLAVTNMSGNDFSDITDEIKRIVTAVEELETSLTQEQIVDLKSDIEKLSDDIVSISSRTNKLLLNSDEAYKALNDGLNNFSNIIYKLEDRLNTDTSERIERKIDNIHSLAVEADNANKVSRQVMMYLGEWIDSAGENIVTISEHTAEIDSIKENIQELKEIIPEKSLILDEIEQKFERQEERIDRLEMGLDKVLSILEQKNDTILERKVDNIEKMLSVLGTNIEKLTSYVDEE